jgi:hypothetical protein
MNIFSDSFQRYTNFIQNYDSVGAGGGPSVSTSQVRTGTQSAFCFQQSIYCTKFFTSRTTYIQGFAIYIVNVMTEFGICAFSDTGTNQVGLTVDAVGALRVRRGMTVGGNLSGTVLGTSSTNVGLGAWHYIELKVKIDSSTGTVDVQLDGLNVLSLTGQNTQNSANNTANQITLGLCTLSFGNTISAYFDDYYINDNSGSSNTSFLGDTSILCQFPSANGTLNNYTNVFASFVNGANMVVGQQLKDSNGNVQRVQSITGTGLNGGSAPTWATTGGATTVSNQVTYVVVGSGTNPGAANWMAVSETPNDDNNSYVTDATPGDIDRYTYPSISGSQVFFANVCIRAEKDDSGTRTIRAAVKSGGTSADNGTDFALTLNSYVNFQGIFEKDPNTSVAWTVSGVNAAEFGCKTTT